MQLFKHLVFDSIINPRSVSIKLAQFNFTKLNIIEATLFVSICSTLVSYLYLNLILDSIPDQVRDESQIIIDILSYMSSIEPVLFALNQTFQLTLLGVIISFGGQIFRGKGTFFEALVCVTWVEFLLLFLKILQVVLVKISIILSFLVLIPGVFWSVWAYAAIAASIHGFKSTFLTFLGGTLLTTLVLFFVNIFS